ncbi:hypothetical protein MHY85_05620 [Cellulomonas sp. ACRRI]|uniref:hypothetical protein n=1 Tax=Cellulomonas sp. ACRRI TaxID=2918188 RepID=UPI001EF27BA2|nr:hypothetical protein [Cellulomonas sp. ACRRI]MCG7285454.1 hypothetical protein [Cellulomonas sp. ACRRI]
MPHIEVDNQTAFAIQLAADTAAISPGEVIRRLIERSRPAAFSTAATVDEGLDGGLEIHAIYDGHRTNAVYELASRRVTITDGPLAGKSFKSPSGAAIAVVSRFRPDVNPNRNGWSFWTVTGTGELLQSVRHPH